MFVFLLYIEFETEQLKLFTQSLTASYDFMENIFFRFYSSSIVTLDISCVVAEVQRGAG